MTRSVRMLIASSLLSFACDGGTPPDATPTPAVTPTSTKPKPEPKPVAPSDAQAEPAAPIPTTAPAPAVSSPEEAFRAETPLAVEAKPVRSLGVRNKALAGMYALEASVRTPDWGRAGEHVAASRDDNLLTAWGCTASDDQPCALELTLPTSASVVAVRLYAAAGTRGPDVEPAKQTVSWPNYKAHPRPAKIRVHTREGYVDATVKDGADDRYLVFASPVETDRITIEVTELHAGKKNEELRVAEVEVFGTTGAARAPLSLDPARTYVRYETTPWSGTTIRQVFLEEAVASGRRRLMRATALHGTEANEGRYVLVERVFKTMCDESEGSYTLLDTNTRVPWALGPLGGVPGSVHAVDGGFVVAAPGAAAEDAKTVRIEAGTAKIERGSDAELANPIMRGIGDASPVPTTCGAPDEATVTASGLGERYTEDERAALLRCNVDGVKVVFTQLPACDKRWSVVVVGTDGTIVAEAHNEDDDGRGLRYAVVDGGRFLIETTKKGGDVTQLHQVSADGLALYADRASFAARPPASCRPCSDAFGPASER